MFQEDRFGPAEDFFATYSALGGRRLGAADVEGAIRSAYMGLAADYSDPRRVDDFPSLKQSLGRDTDIPEDEIAVLERVFAAHEIGQVPPAFAACLRRLEASYLLGVVSNIWARKEPWLGHFEDVGIAKIWRTLVFSSDTRNIKPSPALFRRAVFELGLAPPEILFVGDSLRTDIVPAKALGMSTAWVGGAAVAHPSADWTGPSLLELETTLTSF